jgi:chemotaxis protein CheY-P-specific phosphatase CheC
VREHLGAGEAQAEDSLGETANLIAGHLKRGLARYGQVITITPPIVVRGVTIEVCNTGESCRAEHQSKTDDQNIVAWLDYESAKDIELVEVPDDETVAEGETLFF